MPDVRGVDFGILYADGRPRGRALGIRFHVARKCPLSELTANRLLPAEIDGVPCDVVVAAYEPHAPSRLGALSPACPGISIGNIPRQATGTLGSFVLDEASGRICLLSNWHVLCGSTGAQAGDTISQPGPRHLGIEPARPIAQLLRWLDLSQGLDAAIALCDAGLALDPRPLELPAGPVAVAAPRVGMKVVKSGAISGKTHAMVDGIDGSYPMDYTIYGDSSRWMDGFRLVPDPEHPTSEVSLGGDSGSIWIDGATGAGVGLHFAGEDGLGPLSEYALAHSLPTVFKRLQISPYSG